VVVSDGTPRPCAWRVDPSLNSWGCEKAKEGCGAAATGVTSRYGSGAAQFGGEQEEEAKGVDVPVVVPKPATKAAPSTGDASAAHQAPTSAHDDDGGVTVHFDGGGATAGGASLPLSPLRIDGVFVVSLPPPPPHHSSLPHPARPSAVSFIHVPSPGVLTLWLAAATAALGGGVLVVRSWRAWRRGGGRAAHRQLKAAGLAREARPRDAKCGGDSGRLLDDDANAAGSEWDEVEEEVASAYESNGSAYESTAISSVLATNKVSEVLSVRLARRFGLDGILTPSQETGSREPTVVAAKPAPKTPPKLPPEAKVSLMQQDSLSPRLDLEEERKRVQQKLAQLERETLPIFDAGLD